MTLFIRRKSFPAMVRIPVEKILEFVDKVLFVDVAKLVSNFSTIHTSLSPVICRMTRILPCLFLYLHIKEEDKKLSYHYCFCIPINKYRCALKPTLIFCELYLTLIPKHSILLL